MPEAWETEPRPVRIIENRRLARATFWLSLQLEDEHPLPHRPGNILSVFVDVEGRRLRHPYTISAADPESREVGILYRTVKGGAMTPTLSWLGRGNRISVAGCFGKPIAALIAPDAISFVGIATGSGIGPLAGFVREALSDPAWSLPITLIGGFRSEEDVPLIDQLDAMSEDPRFQWFPSLSAPQNPDYSGPTGRIGQTLPEILPSLKGAHVHLVGNGGMIATVRTALLNANHPPAHLTSETYFNKAAAPDPAAVARLTAAYAGR